MPRVLFPISMAEFPAFDVAPDDPRLLVLEAGTREEGEMILLQNFFEELKAKLRN